jgi:CRP/FNR family transcriptional regulator, anaerobic regulatory protein
MSAVPKLRLVSNRSDCVDCPIRHRAVCSQCEPDELSMLESMKSYRDYRPGDVILWAGEQMTMVGSVVSGVVSLARTMEDGRRQMVGLLLPSDFLGRPDRDTAPYNAVAATDVTLCCFQRRPFQTLVAGTPSIARRLLAMTFDELDAARDWMLLLGRKTAREKIASLLSIFARRSQLSVGTGATALSFDLPLTREAMADYLGLTIETVSRQISALRRDGIIRLEGQRHIHIVSYPDLFTEAGDDTDGGLPGSLAR